MKEERDGKERREEGREKQKVRGKKEKRNNLV